MTPAFPAWEAACAMKDKLVDSQGQTLGDENDNGENRDHALRIKEP